MSQSSLLSVTSEQGAQPDTTDTPADASLLSNVGSATDSVTQADATNALNAGELTNQLAITNTAANSVSSALQMGDAINTSNEVVSSVQQSLIASVQDSTVSSLQSTVQQSVSGQVSAVVTDQISNDVALSTASEVVTNITNDLDLGL